MNGHSNGEANGESNGATNGHSNGHTNDASTAPSNGYGFRNVPTARLDGKTALITGSGRGIGKGIALELASRGADIVIHYGGSEKAALQTVKEIEELGRNAIAIQADVSKPEEIAKLFKQAMMAFGSLDIVVSNAGVEAFFKHDEVTPEEYDYIFNINARAQFFVAQNAYKNLNRGGRVILMSSIAAKMSGVKNHALYAGTKCAVEGFVRSFSADFGDKSITVNAIAPGGVKTDMYTENSWHYVPNGYKGMPLEECDQALANYCPLKRVALANDIARVTAFLASQDGEWVNGQILYLTGGSVT